MSTAKQAPLSGRLNLEQQRKRAKELLQQYRAADPMAIDRFCCHHPHFKHQPHLVVPFAPKLSDAQLVIAQEWGLSSWAKLKAHIDRLDQARQAIAQGQPIALDADLPTLHIRCGSDIQHKLKIAGFCGDFLEFADPYCQGPVPDDTDFDRFLQRRSEFIAQAYRIDLKDAQSRLKREYRQLHQSDRYPRIVLWFEHDAYDQLSLAYLLHYFGSTLESTTNRPQLELICVNAFLGVQPFLGLGQLPPEALRTLWQQRMPVSAQQLDLGHQVWRAYTDSTPDRLHRLIATGIAELSMMARALRRQLQELPWKGDGLSLTQRLTLETVAQEPIAAGLLFRRLTFEKEPLPFLGDTMYWLELDRLSQGDRPALAISPETQSLPWEQRRLHLTPIGQALLQQQINWLEVNAIDRWVGGVHLSPGWPIWVWDETQQAIELLE
jgi:hypothetical protein